MNDEEKKKLRQRVQIGVIASFLLCIIIFKIINEKSIIDLLLLIASYTYGPLLGLYAFGLISNRKIKDNYSWIICLAAPILCYCLNQLNTSFDILLGYKLGMELLIINGIITYFGLYLISKKEQPQY
jgi:ribose/xylose/arabinose/galactoside ABC-type transport system permease subunit